MDVRRCVWMGGDVCGWEEMCVDVREDVCGYECVCLIPCPSSHSKAIVEPRRYVKCDEMAAKAVEVR